MDPLSFGFIAWVVLLGGGIAFLADRLGRHLGKNRLRLFGLRPRHTAEVLTLTAGALIPVITVVILAVASRDIREWLVEGRKAIQKAQDYREEIDRQDNTLRQMRLEVSKAQSQLVAMQANVRQEQARQKEAAKAADDQKKIAAAAKVNAERARRDVATARGQLVSAQSGLRTTSASLKRVQTNWKSVQQSFNALSNQQKELLTENTRLLNENEKLSQDREEIEKQRDEAKKQLDQRQQELKTVNEKFQKELDLLQNDLDNRRQELDRVNTRLEGVQAQLTAAEANLDFAVEVSLRQPLIFHMGEELARMPLRRQMNQYEAEQSLRQLFAQARALAAERGATQSPQFEGESGLVPLRVNVDGEIREVSIEEQEKEIIQKLTSRGNDTVVIARALFNAFQGGYVPLRIDIHDNPLVYKSGQFLSEARIDGTLSNEQILSQISEFLRTKVKQKVIDDRLIPVTGRDNSFAEVTPDEVINIVNRIHDYNRTVRLQVYAREDTRAAGPLRLEFRLR